MSKPLRFKPVNPAHDMIFSADGGWVSWEDYARLKAEVERLTKAVINAEDVIRFTEEGVQNVPFKYDEKYTIEVSRNAYFRLSAVVIAAWQAAKEGKQP